jgi:hypothetical protein
VWPVAGDIAHAGAISDPVERGCGAGRGGEATVVAGRVIMRDGALVDERVEEMLAWHRRVARFQIPVGAAAIARGASSIPGREQAEPDRLRVDRAAVHGHLRRARRPAAHVSANAPPARPPSRAFEVGAIGRALCGWRRNRRCQRYSTPGSDLDTAVERPPPRQR